MSNLSQFFGNPLGQTPRVIVNGFSSSPPSISVVQNDSDKQVLSGALTANTLATALSITGSGSISALYLKRKDATSRTIRLKVTLDGVVVFDSTSAAAASATQGILAIGCMMASDSSVMNAAPIPFSTSCLVEVASSLSETDKLGIYYNYRTN